MPNMLLAVDSMSSVSGIVAVMQAIFTFFIGLFADLFETISYAIMLYHDEIFGDQVSFEEVS